MVVYKRGGSYWADFTVSGQRFRLPLRVTNKQEAANLEKAKIAEAQSHGGLLPTQTAKLTVADAGVVYFSGRAAEVSPSTIRLETDAFKQVKRHLGSAQLGSINLGSLADYIKKRKAENIGNRTINMEVGVLRRVLKKYKLWNRLAEDYRRLPESTDIGRALSPEEELKLFQTASSRAEWEVVFWISLITANTTAGGIELRNVRLGDIDLKNQTLMVRVGKNRFRTRILPLNQTALWAIERLLERAKDLGATKPEHYLIPSRVSGKAYDPTQPPSRWGWRTAWRRLTAECGLKGLRPHDLRHHAITKLAESSEASEQTIMSIAGHVSIEMLRHYSHIRQEAKRKAVSALDNVTITSHLARWKAEAEEREKQNSQKSNNLMVGTGRFELPTPRTPNRGPSWWPPGRTSGRICPRRCAWNWRPRRRLNPNPRLPHLFSQTRFCAQRRPSCWRFCAPTRACKSTKFSI
jgi:integrase